MAALDAAYRRLDAFVRRRMRAEDVPGLVVALTDGHRDLRVATFGYADLAARRRVTSGTRFEIGSISKSLTAIAVLQQVEAGRLALHAPVVRYLPWFAVRSAFDPITVHHLLTHTAGIPQGTEVSGEARYEAWALRDTEVGFPPGTRFHYSNLGYKILGLILEAVTGMTASEVVHTRILAPLGMVSTEAAITHATRSRLAIAYADLYDDRPPHPRHPRVPAPWLETDTADGSLATTAGDLARYLRMLLNGGRGPRGRLLSEEGFQLLVEPRIEPRDGSHPGRYAYGLLVAQEDGHAVLGHSGRMVGYDASIIMDLDAALGVAVLANANVDTWGTAAFALRLLRSARETGRLPRSPPSEDARPPEDPAAYKGVYRGRARALVVDARGGRLYLRLGRRRVSMEPRGPDRFYVDHPEFDRFLLVFGRADGRAVEAFHGGDWYVGEGYAGPRAFEVPAEWGAFPGHYRTYNPWIANFRVVLRKGELRLIHPEGSEELMVPTGRGVFRVGSDPSSPERIRFDVIVDGKALRATLSGCEAFRTFTP